MSILEKLRKSTNQDADDYGETRTLDMHIKSLRSKLEEFTPNKYIVTVRGVGYKFCKINNEE